MASEKMKNWPFPVLLWLSLAIAIILGFYLTERLVRGSEKSSSASEWTPELEELWRPFLQPNKPLIVAIEDPLFLKLQKGSGVYYRDRSVNKMEDLLSSQGVVALQKALKNPEATANHSYTAFGEVAAVFIMGKFLGPASKTSR